MTSRALALIALGLADPLAEHRLTCQDLARRTPALYGSGARALTDYGGVCYVLAR